MIRLSPSPGATAGSTMPTDDAVTVWLGQLQAGDSAAARPLWEKYFHRLVGLARTRLRDAPRGPPTRRTWPSPRSTASAATPRPGGSPT